MKKSVIAILMLTLAASGADGQSRLRNKGKLNSSFVGGKVGLSVPTGMGRSADQIAFNDVCSKGFVGSADFMHVSRSNIALGVEAAYVYMPYNKNYWGSLETRGSFEADYKTAQLNGFGQILLSRKDVKPFLGIAFGGNYLRNSVDFSSDYSGTADDESVQYVSEKLKAGFGIHGGIYHRVGLKCLLSIRAQLYFIPYLSKEEKRVTDPYTFQERIIVVNPHGNQTHVTITAGLHFGVGRR